MTDKNHKLSIIIPCFNCSKTVERAVASVYRQKLNIPFEIIMIDDCSTDDTRTIIADMAKKYPNIKYFWHDKNLGGGATRNLAVSKSKGDIIFCLDSDDILPDGTLIKMIDFWRGKKCDGVTIHRSIKFIGNDINNIDHVDISPYVGAEIGSASLFSRKKYFYPLYVNFMYTRKVFDKIGGYPTSHGYDTQGFAWRFLCAGFTAYTCPNAEYLHRIHFNESYYLREYNNGKMNYNWRDILIENYYVFNKKALNFIITFDCRDFTRSIMDELIAMNDILVPNFKNVLGKPHPPLITTFPKAIYIKRNSMRGWFFRIKHRLKKFISKNK